MAEILLLRCTSVDGLIVEHGFLPRHAQNVLAGRRFQKTLPTDDAGEFLRAATRWLRLGSAGLRVEDERAVAPEVACAALLRLDAALRKESMVVLTMTADGVSYDRVALTAVAPRRFADRLAAPVVVEAGEADPSSIDAYLRSRCAVGTTESLFRTQPNAEAWLKGRLKCRGRPEAWSERARASVFLKETNIVLELVDVAREPAWRRLVDAVTSTPSSSTCAWRVG